jgi:hypothetical protein
MSHTHLPLNNFRTFPHHLASPGVTLNIPNPVLDVVSEGDDSSVVSVEEFAQEELNEEDMVDDDDSGSDGSRVGPDVPDDYVLNEPIRVRRFRHISSPNRCLIEP